MKMIFNCIAHSVSQEEVAVECRKRKVMFDEDHAAFLKRNGDWENSNQGNEPVFKMRNIVKPISTFICGLGSC